MNNLLPTAHEIIFSTAEHRVTLEEISEALLQDDLITLAQHRQLLNDAVLYARKAIHPLLSVSRMNWRSANDPQRHLSLEQLTIWLAGKTDMPYFHIDPLKIEFRKLFSLISYSYATQFHILPVERTQTTLTVATCEPFIRAWKKNLEHTSRLQIRRVLANPVDISHYLHKFNALGIGVPARSHEASQHLRLVQDNRPNRLKEHIKQFLKAGKAHQKMPLAPRMVDLLLDYAIEQRASDIHIEPRPEYSAVLFRIDGELHNVYEIETSLVRSIVSRFKVLGRMNVVDRRKPQTGRFSILHKLNGGKLDIRISSMPTNFGEKLAIRIFDPGIVVSDFQKLGFSKDDDVLWKKMLKEPYGIILVTGPTGSGKTSTLYSSLKFLGRQRINICTLEDPIEIEDPAFNQMELNRAIGVNFTEGVSTLLHQDPDVIMVGEIRDRDTAEVSMQAALTGHLVLSSLHTNDSPLAITRLLNIGVPAYLISATLEGILAQRLVRILCPYCKQPARPDLKQWHALTSPHSAPAPEYIYLPIGCVQCRYTGFKGRTSLVEILQIDEGIKDLITKQVDISTIYQYTLQKEWRPLRFKGAEKIGGGLTTYEEVVKVIKV